MEVLSYNVIDNVGVEVLFGCRGDSYSIILDPRLKLSTQRGKVKATKLKKGDEVTAGDKTLEVVSTYRRPDVQLITLFTKVQHKYPFIKKVCVPDCKAYSKEELKELLLKSDYKFAMSMYDGISLETQYPGYYQYLPGSVLAEDEDFVVDSEKELDSFVEF